MVLKLNLLDMIIVKAIGQIVDWNFANHNSLFMLKNFEQFELFEDIQIEQIFNIYA